MKQFVILSFLAIILTVGSCKPGKEVYRADVIIYGGTSAGVAAAVQATRMGMQVILVSPDKHPGGLSSSGLGFTDVGNKAVIGGISREFYQRIYRYYQQDSAWKWQKKEEYGNQGQGIPAIDGENRTMWIFEPHAAEIVFEDFVRENNIVVYRDEWIKRPGGVKKTHGRILSIETLSGKEFRAEVFIDASYEGDLMAEAGVQYRVGRESTAEYGEQWNGVQTGIFHHGHFFRDTISPYRIPGDPTSGLLPLISAEIPGAYGSADHQLQAYCYRMCLTRDKRNSIPLSRPAIYDSTMYELLLRVFNTGWRETLQKFDPIPNHKTDVNNHGPFSFDFIGMNYDYPEASYERRKEILRQHENYQKGLLYFLSSDPRVPAEVRSEMQQWGLAADEFTDNGNWPYQIYVREARRMVGLSVMTELEILGKKPVPESIGMGSYTMDSHNTQRYVTPKGYVQNEGDIGVHPEKPYRIDRGSILPLRTDCRNLIVPVALSSTHIAYGSIRMEPVFMILGQSAGTIAVLAAKEKMDVQEILYSTLKEQLLAGGQVLE
jgi:hypothetical protein